MKPSQTISLTGDVIRPDSRQRVYDGRNLLQIAMPMGGIGSGCICLNGYGGLQDFSIRHAPSISAMPDRHMPLDAGFALLRLPGTGDTRLVEGPFPPEKIYNLGLKSQGYNGGGFEGLPRFRDCTFQGEYPFGVVRLSDPDLPIAVRLTVFNPFIPLDDVASGIPAVILEYTLQNTDQVEVEYEFSYHLSHLASKGKPDYLRSRALPALGVHFWNDEPPISTAFGSAALGILDGNPLIKARWLRGGWFDSMSALWREVSTGTFEPNDRMESGAGAARCGGSVLVSGTLAPGAITTHRVVIAWHFPNITTASVGNIQLSGPAAKTGWRPFYAVHWKDASAVLGYVRENYAHLRRRTQAFHDALFSSTLPDSVLDAVSANLAVLKSPTVLRHDSGVVWGWEGCFCDGGCCPGSCTHVWNYAQSMAHLFPALERTLREAELQTSMNEIGHVSFRIPPPGEPAAHDFHPAADGQLGGIMKVHREWQTSGDRDWLERIYPLAKRSMDFCIDYWDPRGVGLVEEPHHNTYDIEFWGPDGLCSSFYLGALAAIAAMARDLGHDEDARRYESLAAAGAAEIEARLFNGAYYQQEIMIDGLRDTSFRAALDRLADDGSEEARLLKSEGPKYQVGSGCLSDGVFGAWLADLCGVTSPQNRASIRSHLGAIYEHNFRPSLWRHANTQRPGYALGDEAGLLLCSWPRGGKPTLPFVYSDEVWTGIEYQVAAHMIALGMVQEGIHIVDGARSRYDGLKRNPWCEYECGNYYARAMASYGLLIAFSGFHYSAPARRLTIAPKIEVRPFACFFSTAFGWGTFTLREDTLQIAVVEGELPLDEIHIQLGDSAIILPVNKTIQAGEPTSFALEEK